VLLRAALTGQLELLNADQHQHFALVERGRLKSAAVIPVGIARRYGVLLAAHAAPQDILARDVLMLELIVAQLGTFLARSR
jgi:GAF domain-containing protein